MLLGYWKINIKSLLLGNHLDEKSIQDKYWYCSFDLNNCIRLFNYVASSRLLINLCFTIFSSYYIFGELLV